MAKLLCCCICGTTTNDKDDQDQAPQSIHKKSRKIQYNGTFHYQPQRNARYFKISHPGDIDSSDNLNNTVELISSSYKVIQMNNTLKQTKEFDNKIQYWKLKFNYSDNDEHGNIVSQFDCIGVMPANTDPVCAWSDGSMFYGIGGSCDTIFRGRGQFDTGEHLDVPLNEWIIIKYIYHSNKLQKDDLIFELQKDGDSPLQLIFEMKLPNGHKWYPAVSFSYAKYHVVCTHYINHDITWQCERQIWIAFHKNCDSEKNCWLPLLSKDLIFHILSFLRSEVTER